MLDGPDPRNKFSRKKLACVTFKIYLAFCACYLTHNVVWLLVHIEQQTRQ